MTSVPATSETYDPAPVKSAPVTKVALSSWWMLAVLLMLFSLSMVDRHIITMLVEPIKRDLQLTDFEVSLILGPAFAIFFAIGGVPCGYAADHLKRRWVVFAGVAIWSLATAASGLATGFALLATMRLMVSAGEACISPCAMSLIGDAFPRNRVTRAVSIYQIGLLLSHAITFAAGGAAIAWAGDLVQTPMLAGKIETWQLTFAMVGLPGLAFALLVFTFPDPKRREAGTSRTESQEMAPFLKKNWKLFALIVLGFALSSTAGNALTWAPTFIERQYGWTPKQYSGLLSAVSFISAAVVLIEGTFVDKLFTSGVKDAHIRFYSWKLVVAIPCAAAAFFMPNPVTFIILYGIVNAILSTYSLYAMATATILAPTRLRGRIAGLFLSSFILIGASFGPTLVGFVTNFIVRDEQKLGLSVACVAASCLLASFIVLRASLKGVSKAVKDIEAAEAEDASLTPIPS